MAKLKNNRHERFCQEYLIDLNATQAAIRAGYSEKTAGSQGQRLLKNVETQGRIQELQDARAERTEITADMVLKELAKLAFSNMEDYVTFGASGVTLKESSTLTRDQLAAVSEVSETVTEKGGSIRFKLYNKRDALTDLGRHFGLFVDKHELTGKDGAPIQHALTIEDFKRERDKRRKQAQEALEND